MIDECERINYSRLKKTFSSKYSALLPNPIEKLKKQKQIRYPNTHVYTNSLKCWCSTI